MDKLIILEARDIVKNFPGVRALDRIQLQLQKGEVHALVGENGAGKSTLMHILGGVYKPDSGDVFIEGKKVKLQNPYHASQEGISVVYQELSLVQNLSIAENIFANRQPLKRMKLVDWNLLYQKTSEVLKYFNLEIDPRTPVKELSVAEQQVVEILKAISYNPKVLILDEPTSSLTQIETKLLFKNIKLLKEKGVSFVYISHHLQEIFEIADRVTIFRDGKYIDTRNISEVNEEQVVKLMVGREIQNMYGDRNSKIGEEYFQVENLSQDGVFTEVSFSLKRGEILGVAGLVGAGRTELARAIFGLEPFSEGSIRLNGKVLSIYSPGDAIQEGIAYLTEDRHQGLFLKMS
ncbi:MAG TPA: D-xylose ABC transporter ATP-binding protein, partial [Candidatus Atribacteria bacterium]|nr:D-xylose ABC transporter ATP-binding protein [Candidatus Atribacteria bacterium]